MERISAATDNPVVILQHDKVAHVFADLRQRAGQQGAVAGVGRDECMNLLRIGQNRFTRAHGFLCALAKGFFLLSPILISLFLHGCAMPRPGP